MQNARFSISVPVGAYHELLPTCFASLACQREFCAVSLLDASSDERVRSLADRFDFLFAYRRHGPDKGQADAIVEGWRNAPGEILGWLNADDFLYPDAFGLALGEFVENPAIDVVNAHSAICDRAGRMTGYHWAVEPGGEALRSGCVISQPSCFFKRAACDAAGGLDASLHYTMDWDLWLRLLDAGAKFGFVDEPLSTVYWGEGTKTTDFGPERRRELERLISRYTPPVGRAKARRGFAIRSALDQLPSPLVKRVIERRLRRRQPFVLGVGPNGALGGHVTLKWMHFDPAPRRSLKITLDRARQVTCDAHGAHNISREENALLIEFHEPVPPATKVTVHLNVAPGSAARLVACEWM